MRDNTGNTDRILNNKTEDRQNRNTRIVQFKINQYGADPLQVL